MKNPIQFLFLVITGSLSAQNIEDINMQVSQSKNLVSDSSFERMNCGHSGKYLVISSNVWRKYKATPDYFSDTVNILEGKKKEHSNGVPKNFEAIEYPHSGHAYIGLVTYNKYKPYKRYYSEAVYSELNTTLKEGYKYHIEMFVSLSERSSIATKDFGIYFGDSITKPNYAYAIFPMDYIEQDTMNSVILHEEGGNFVIKSDGWTKIEGDYVAKGKERFIRFFSACPNAETIDIVKSNKQKKQYPEGAVESYYFIDDVSVRVIDSSETRHGPIEPIKENISFASLLPGETLILKNVLFETGKSVLLPSSFEELATVLEYLKKTDNTKVEIDGYTDNQGTESFNLQLSIDRAKAVIGYLQGKGISSSRLNYKGFGDTKSIATNKTEEGRKLNRRVEFKLLSQ